jgi:hypothetical protein
MADNRRTREQYDEQSVERLTAEQLAPAAACDLPYTGMAVMRWTCAPHPSVSSSRKSALTCMFLLRLAQLARNLMSMGGRSGMA